MAELNTSEINERLGGVKVTGELLVELGIPPTRREKRAMYWDEAKFAEICEAIMRHIRAKVHQVNAIKATADDLFGE